MDMLSSRSNNFFRNFLLLLFFYCGIFLLALCIEAYTSNTKAFSEVNLLNWDAGHYFAVMQGGYHDENVAFFPLFPFFWKIIHASIAAMSIINGLIFIASLSWLAEEFNFRKRNLLLVASIPSLIFMFLPFSEALFFFTGVIILIGLEKKNTMMLLTGLLLAGISRPVATVFIPAILITEYVEVKGKFKNFKPVIFQLIFCLLGLLLVFTLQYWQTGRWFSFFEYQKNWNNYLRLPHFPLSSWAGGYIVRLDAIAFFFGVAALAITVYIIAKARKPGDEYSKPLVFSLSFLALLMCIVLFTKGGTFNSFNRYLFASPFFLFALNNFLEKIIFRWKNFLLLFIFSSATWLLFASYVHIQTVLKFETLSIYLCSLLLCVQSVNKKIGIAALIAIVSANIFFFIDFLHRFLSGEWVG